MEGRQPNTVPDDGRPLTGMFAGEEVCRRPLSVIEDTLAVRADLNAVERSKRALGVAKSVKKGACQQIDSQMFGLGRSRHKVSGQQRRALFISPNGVALNHSCCGCCDVSTLSEDGEAINIYGPV
jgi:hypothetical protein